MRARVCFAVAVSLLVSAMTVSADKVDELTAALRSDPSYRVRVQAALVLGKLNKDPRSKMALVAALKDDSEAVRAVAASSLGKLGDPTAIDALRGAKDDASAAVRSAAGKAIAALEKTKPHGGGASPSGGSSGGKVFLELSPIAAGQGGPEAAKRVHDRVATRLGMLAGVTLDPAETATRKFYVDGNITNLATSAPDGEGRVRIDCDVRVVVATWPERSIKMMATVGGSTDGANDPKDIAAARDFCLNDAAAQIVSKVESYLETTR